MDKPYSDLPPPYSETDTNSSAVGGRPPMTNPTYYPGTAKPMPTAPPPHQQQGPPPNYGSMNQHGMPTEIIIIGGCPACRIGVLEDDYPFLALTCAILFFPLGILACLAMKQKRCTNCGAEF